MPRRAKPDNIHKLAGSYKKCRHGNRKKVPVVSASDIKPNLHLTELASKHWHVISEHLEKAKLLSHLDADALSIYCEHFALWYQATQELETNGMTVVHPKTGVINISPFLKISMINADMIRKMLVEFGMTPASRASMKADTPNTETTENPFESWLKNKDKVSKSK